MATLASESVSFLDHFSAHQCCFFSKLERDIKCSSSFSQFLQEQTHLSSTEQNSHFATAGSRLPCPILSPLLLFLPIALGTPHFHSVMLSSAAWSTPALQFCCRPPVSARISPLCPGEQKGLSPPASLPLEPSCPCKQHWSPFLTSPGGAPRETPKLCHQLDSPTRPHSGRVRGRSGMGAALPKPPVLGGRPGAVTCARDLGCLGMRHSFESLP